MMLCKADFEDLFPDLFGTASPNGANRHPARNSLSDFPESHPLSVAVEWPNTNSDKSLEPAPMPKTRLVAAD